MPQLEFDGSIAICAARSLPASFGTCWIERTGGESVVMKWSRRIETTVVAAELAHDGFLARCTLRVGRQIRWTRAGNTRVAACQ